MASSPITSWQIEGEKVKTVTDFIFLASKITEDGDCSHEIQRHLLFGRKALENIAYYQRHHFLWQVCIVKAIVFPVVMYRYECWIRENAMNWMLKNWCFWIVVLEKTLENPLDSKEIKPVNPKGTQSWISIRRTDADAEAPILGPSDVKSRLIWKDFDPGKHWGWEEKGLQRMRWLDGSINTMDMSLSTLWETVKHREAWHAVVHGIV